MDSCIVLILGWELSILDFTNYLGLLRLDDLGFFNFTFYGTEIMYYKNMFCFMFQSHDGTYAMKNTNTKNTNGKYILWCKLSAIKLLLKIFAHEFREE